MTNVFPLKPVVGQNTATDVRQLRLTSVGLQAVQQPQIDLLID